MTARMVIKLSDPISDPRLNGADVEAFEEVFRSQIMEGDLEGVVRDLLATEQVELLFEYDPLTPAQMEAGEVDVASAMSDATQRQQAISAARANARALLEWMQRPEDAQVLREQSVATLRKLHELIGRALVRRDR